MNKIIIIGCPGAGKSTFARRLRDITNLPLYYLDYAVDECLNGISSRIGNKREDMPYIEEELDLEFKQ